MVLYILILAVGCWLGFKRGQLNFKKKEGEKWEVFFFGAAGIFIAVIILLVLTGLMTGINNVKKISYTEYDKKTIVALKNSQSLGGSMGGNFLIFAGQIGQTPYYFFYYLLPDGGKRLGKVDANEAVIYEEKRADGYLVKTGTTTYYKNISKWKSWLLFPSFFQFDDELSFSTYAIHVPEGTVKRKIDLDLKDLN